jgi:lon-related putative ATP-dependent protease
MRGAYHHGQGTPNNWQTSRRPPPARTEKIDRSPMAALSPEELAHRADPADMPGPDEPLAPDESSDAAPGPLLVGHERARRAIELAFGIEADGYNVFVTGPPASGKLRFVEDAIRKRGKRGEPLDWVYVNNFASPARPLAIGLPPCMGPVLREDMRRLVEELKATIPAAFEAEGYANEVERIQAEFAERHTKALSDLNEEAMREGIGLIQTPNGFTLAPIRDGDVLTNEEFAKLGKERQQEIQEKLLLFQEKLQKIVRDSIRMRKEQIERVQKLNRDTTVMAVGGAIDELLERYGAIPKLCDWIRSVRDDILENADDFLPARKPFGDAARSPLVAAPDLGRYEVNLLRTCEGEDATTPVVRAQHPTLVNLIGRVDHRAMFGTLVSDFRLIRAGDLHRANGGYLLVDALRLVTEPFAWPALKRALERRSIRIESPADVVGVISAAQVEPEPIPLDVKVALFGDRHLYYLLDAYDPDFRRLFKIVADFDDDLPRDAEHQRAIANAIRAQARRRGLLPLTRSALARLVDEGSRQAEDAGRVSAELGLLGEVAVEADAYARGNGRKEIDRPDIVRAIASRRDRAARSAEAYRRSIIEGTLAIATSGERVGQVNGLAVYELGGEYFGHPSRITATAALGEGKLLDIQRETDLGGSIHSKGVLILASFLNARYSARDLMSLTASIVFEQSYGPVDGDSATIAETCALLSAIADVPLRQSLAVTGSMNQFGDVQAIGGVNEKIEGFFDVCRERGLDGSHGVIIPKATARHLMLRDDVVAAVAAGKFAVHAISHVDEAIELLSGMPAGDPIASLADRCFNARVVARLHALSQLRRGMRPGVPMRQRQTQPGQAGKHD